MPSGDEGAAKAAGGVAEAGSLATDVASDGVTGTAAGRGVETVIAGDGSDQSTNTLARYAGTATSGAVSGGMGGGDVGAALGAAKNVATEAAGDIFIGGARAATGMESRDAPKTPQSDQAGEKDSDASSSETGDAKEASEAGGGTGGAAGGQKLKKAALTGAAVAAPVATTVIAIKLLLAWLKSLMLAALAQVANLMIAVIGFITGLGKSIAQAAAAPFLAASSAVGTGIGMLTGVTVSATAAGVATAGISVVSVLAIVVTTVGGLSSQAERYVDELTGSTVEDCVLPGGFGSGSGTFTGAGVPPEAIPWIENAAAHSTQGIPAAFFAYIMDRETDFRPALFADDINGGTWGLFQINAYEWNKATGGNFDNPDIRDPMIHTTYGAQYFDARLETVRKMRTNNPDKPYAKQLTELEALMIAHNAGEGNLMKYPNIPRITQSYLDEFREKFAAYGGGAPTGGGVTGSIGQGASNLSLACEQALSADGGITAAQAQDILGDYNTGGDAYLDEKYGAAGGPPTCGDKHHQSALSFVTWFLNSFTLIDTVAPGTGVDTASLLAQSLKTQTTTTPTPYSIASGPGDGTGRTAVVLGVFGNQVILGEATQCADATIIVTTVSDLQAEGWTFASVSHLVGEGGTDPDGLPIYTPPTGSSGNAALDAARSQIGLPYVWGGGDENGPGAGRQSVDRGEIGFDCSGLTRYAVYRSTGKILPRTSGAQKNAMTQISQSEAVAGDIVWWPGHIGVYTGDGRVVHASHSNNRVVESGLWGSPVFLRVP